MKRLGAAIVFCIALVLLACGGGSNSSANTLTGDWTATLSNPDGTGAVAFSATLTQSGEKVSVSNVTFNPSSTCFATGTTASGLASTIYTTHGVTSGNFQMSLQSGASNTNGANTITLSGAFARQSMSGTWSLSGTGIQCTPPENSTSGTFTMYHMAGSSSGG